MTTESLDLLIYSSRQQRWGFRFRVPKFHGYDSLHIVCDVYVCSPSAESKSRCDRSCLDPRPTTTRIPPSSRRVRRFSRRTAPPGDDVDRGLAETELFVVVDTGHGPIIGLDQDGRLVVTSNTEGVISTLHGLLLFAGPGRCCRHPKLMRRKNLSKKSLRCWRAAIALGIII